MGIITLTRKKKALIEKSYNHCPKIQLSKRAYNYNKSLAKPPPNSLTTPKITTVYMRIRTLTHNAIAIR